MRLLITGASGFIGTNFILSAPRSWEIIAVYNKGKRLEKLVQQRGLKNVKLIHCDLTSPGQVKGLAGVIGAQPINVLYLAGNSDPQLSARDPQLDYKLNAGALLNFLNKVNVARLVYFSSGAVYDGLRGPVSPSSAINPHLPYAVSKLACEKYIKKFHTEGKIRQYVIVRFFGAYGPFEPERKIYTKLIKAFYLAKQNTFEVYGNGKNLIDAVYIDEVVRVVRKILGSKKSNLTLDLCHAKPITIDQLVRKAADIFGIKNLEIIHKGQSAEPIHFRPSQAGVKKYFGTTMRDNLEKNLKKFAANFSPL